MGMNSEQQWNSFDRGFQLYIARAAPMTEDTQLIQVDTPTIYYTPPPPQTIVPPGPHYPTPLTKTHAIELVEIANEHQSMFYKYVPELDILFWMR